MIRPLSDSVLNEQLDKENKEKLEIAKNVDDALLVEPELIVAAERVGKMDDGDVTSFEIVGGSQEVAKATKALEAENMNALLENELVKPEGNERGVEVVPSLPLVSPSMLSNSASLVNPATSNLQSTLLETSANGIRRLTVITVANEDVLSGYDSANAGDTIELVYGTLFAPSSTIENGGDEKNDAAIQIMKAVTITCTDVVNRCKWDGLDARRVVYINTGTEVTTALIGLEITGGTSSDNTWNVSKIAEELLSTLDR